MEVDHNQNQNGQARKIFVGGLNKQTTSEQLANLMSDYGEIEKSMVVTEGQDKSSRGFGFVVYASQDSVDKVLRARKNGVQFKLDGHNLDVKKAIPTKSLNRKLFVGGLFNTTYNDILDYFVQFGPVQDVDIHRFQDSGKPRGFCFVTFENEESTNACIRKRNHSIKGFSCEVRKAQTRATLEGEKEKEERASTQLTRLQIDDTPIEPTMPMSQVTKLVAEAHMKGIQEGMKMAMSMMGSNHGNKEER